MNSNKQGNVKCFTLTFSLEIRRDNDRYYALKKFPVFLMSADRKLEKSA